MLVRGVRARTATYTKATRSSNSSRTWCMYLMIDPVARLTLTAVVRTAPSLASVAGTKTANIALFEALPAAVVKKAAILVARMAAGRLAQFRWVANSVGGHLQKITDRQRLFPRTMYVT